MSFKLFMDCKKAGLICDKAQYEESGFNEKIQLGIHILLCGPCRAHTKKNVKLTELLKKAKIRPMPEDQKRALQQLINEELSK